MFLSPELNCVFLDFFLSPQINCVFFESFYIRRIKNELAIGTPWIKTYDCTKYELIGHWHPMDQAL